MELERKFHSMTIGKEYIVILKIEFINGENQKLICHNIKRKIPRKQFMGHKSKEQFLNRVKELKKFTKT